MINCDWCERRMLSYWIRVDRTHEVNKLCPECAVKPVAEQARAIERTRELAQQQGRNLRVRNLRVVQR